MYKTTDGGNNWNKLNAYTGGAMIIALAPDNKALATQDDNLIYRSIDGGDSFT